MKSLTASGLRTRLLVATATAMLGALVALLPALSTFGLNEAGAVGSAQVSVTPRVPVVGQATTVQLTGSGFQSVKNGFGGIYVLFGVVRGTWRPSQGGASGLNYLYVPDSEQKDNHGYQRFVAYPGDSTASAANGGTLAADGSWRTTLVIPGSVLRVQGRDGSPVTVDCRVEQCGVITIGAHGVVNPDNETFTPISFALPAAAPVTRSTVPPTSAKASPKLSSPAAPSSSHRPSRPASTPGVATTPSETAKSSPTASPLSASPVAATQRTTSSSYWPAVLVVGVLAVLVIAAGLWWRRQRTRS